MPDNGGNCRCCEAPKLIFPCSGASDVGEIADRAARELTRRGTGRMYCLAGIGGRVSGIMASTESAAAILAIDGCAQDCASKTLGQAGFEDFLQLRLSDMGLAKGQSPVTDGRIAAVADQGAEKLAGKKRGCCG